METEIKLDAQLWEQFVHAARKSGRDPISLLTDYIREFLRTVEEEDEFLNLLRQAVEQHVANPQASLLLGRAHSTLPDTESES
jgi:hypothetical protein